MSTGEIIRQRIESAGYRVTGYRDAIGDGQDGPLVLTAVKGATGESYTVEVYAKGIDAEVEAFRRLAERVGIRLDDEG